MDNKKLTNDLKEKAKKTASFKEIKGKRSDIDVFLYKIEELNKEFEFYFMGKESIPPIRQLEKMKKEMKQLQKMLFNNSKDRFYLKRIDQKFQLYCAKWNRNVRLKMNGEHHVDIFRKEHFAHLEEEARRETEKSQELFDKLSKATRETISRTKLKNFIERKKRELAKRDPKNKYAFDIVKKDGKLGVVARKI